MVEEHSTEQIQPVVEPENKQDIVEGSTNDSNTIISKDDHNDESLTSNDISNSHTKSQVQDNGKDTTDQQDQEVSDPEVFESHNNINGQNTTDQIDIEEINNVENDLSQPPEEDVADVDTSSDIPTPLPKVNVEVENSNNNHERHHSITSTVSGVSHPNNAHISFVKTAITSISEHKDVKKNQNLLNSTSKTLEKLQSGFDSYLVFESLSLAIESKSVDVILLALDCISKIFTFQLFESIQVPAPNRNEGKPDLPANDDQIENTVSSSSSSSSKVNLIDAAIEVIASSFEGEGTDERIEIQVTRALVAAALNEQLPPHGAILLRAVRQIYNIFILSLSPANQGIAQASLTQIVNVIFERVEKLPYNPSTKSGIPLKSDSNLTLNEQGSRLSRQGSTSNSFQQNNGTEEEPLTLQNLKDLNDEQEKIVDQENVTEDENEQIVKDAFLLFRAMCKLSVKTLESESLDMRSHAVRSKLISLHIIHSIIKEHIDVFLSNNILIHSSSSKDSTIFVDAVRQYLCLTISRNAASSISPVFETTLEIFWLIVSNLRSQFKREIPVFLNEIYFPVAELKTSTSHQKRYFLIVIQRLSNDPRALIEFYLNYDCDPSLPNICEKITDYLTKLALTRVDITPSQKAAYKEHETKSIATYNLSQLPLLSISKLSSQTAILDNNAFPIEYALKITSLNSIVGIIRSLNSWAQKGLTSDARSSSWLAATRKRSSTNGSALQLSSPITSNFPEEVDDPLEFENLKQRKTALQEGIRQFNFKPKKGLVYLTKEGFIADGKPETIANFLLEQPGLDKAVIGEYLGEGDEANIAIMHAFVDSMDFANSSFVDAMRTFLQAFRLPGESQKIDRYMLKFAERYLDGNPGVFANADTAYVLAYSVVMLNTDQHSKNVKHRMTIEDFIKNNRGIDDGKSLQDSYLINIFNEISSNEIKLQSEQHAALLAGDILPPQQSFGLFSGRDVTREAYNQASKEISVKTEKLFKNLGRSKRGHIFYSASHVEHVRSIFDTLWMSFLAALTTPFKDLDDKDTTKICLEGIKLSVGISCIFELDYARTSFVGALIQFANASNYQDLKDKNIEAIILLLKIAETNGNLLKDSWKDILTLISQVERLQLIAQGIHADSLPDVSNARVHRTSIDSQRTTNSSNYGFFGFGKKASLSEQAQSNHQNQQLNHAIGQRLISTELSIAIDKVFTQSAQLNGTAIIDFIKALAGVASEEIESSLDSSTPRTFSLQKVIDVCYYNMGRIRLEWSPIWAVIGGCFNNIGTKHNLSIVFFALDSLRQLSVRFLDIEELAGFKFQEDFLKPFDYILQNSKNDQVSEMVLNCLENLIKVKGEKIKSGWKSIFAALKRSAQESNEKIVSKTLEISLLVYKDFADNLLAYDDACPELISVLKEISGNSKYQKIALHSLQTIKVINVKIAETTLDSKDGKFVLRNRKDIFTDLWYPALSSFNEVIMTGDDLEIRSRALNYLFDVLVQFGNRFEEDFWDRVCTNLLFPIFSVLSKHWEINQFNSHDDLSVWLSTTLIQALRNMIALFTHYFYALNKMMDGYLGLLISCICQENDTIARIGRSCFQQLITQNMEKFTQEHWDRVTEAFEKLFDLTTAKELLEADPLRQGSDETIDGTKEDSIQKTKAKNAIVVKCILQLLMIETLSELYDNEVFYDLIPYTNLLRLSSLLEKSFRFARSFNDDYNLRVRLFNSGVTEKLPNLLKQESSSAAVYIGATFKLYSDSKKITPKQKDIISASLIPMCGSIVERYAQLDDATQQRNITTWRPVVVEILQGYCELEEKDFDKNCPHLYDLVLNILDKSVPSELRAAIKAFFARVGDVYIKDDKD
ncbi:hypothetical protein WICMUC_001942 [Wickerhamomyces mucosus]|uniref:SEC7 domain-containing protein n=1 Tax=Wickerhamomyces mucosus TaxID=1378264 RepID=A0A9P8PRP9_9ASCO|nr:hypothetical protein WICMUC_001942 [Wickerhamomyces mucosus]